MDNELSRRETDEATPVARRQTADGRPPTAAEAGTPARPVLKWAGGKGRLLGELVGRLPGDFNSRDATYHEPFIGGGALFFALAGRERLGRARLSDANPSLIDVYLALRVRSRR